MKLTIAIIGVVIAIGLAILIYIYLSGGIFTPSPCRYAYDCTKLEFQTAVDDYKENHDGELSIINGTVSINGTLYYIIDACLLIGPNRGLHNVPDSCAAINGSNNDNCDGGGCSGCYDDCHYIWAVDDYGNVISTCIGEECKANSEDGDQNIWP